MKRLTQTASLVMSFFTGSLRDQDKVERAHDEAWAQLVADDAWGEWLSANHLAIWEAGNILHVEDRAAISMRGRPKAGGVSCYVPIALIREHDFSTDFFVLLFVDLHVKIATRLGIEPPPPSPTWAPAAG